MQLIVVVEWELDKSEAVGQTHFGAVRLAEKEFECVRLFDKQ